MISEIEGINLVRSAYDNIPLSGYEVLNPIMEEFGFIYIKDNTIEVAIRGTENAHDVITDADCDTHCSPYGGVHHGGWMKYRQLSGSMINVIQHYCKTHTVEKIKIRGHSMGTWLATLLAIEIADLNPSLHLYAPPRIGDIEFVQFVRRLKLDINSYGSRYDLVVKNPPHLCHVENIQYLEFRNVDHLDELGNHKLENFIPAFNLHAIL